MAECDVSCPSRLFLELSVPHAPPSSPVSSGVRERLLEHACTLFAEQGFQRARTQDVCRAARTNPAAANYYFGGKEGLYKAVWDKVVEDAVQAMDIPALSANADREWLYHYLRASVLAMFDAGPGGNLRRLVSHELKEPSPLCDEVLSNHMAPRTQELDRRLRRLLGPRSSEFQVACCLVAIHSQCTALSLSRHLQRRLFAAEGPSEEEVQRFARELCAFIMGGIRAMRAVPQRPPVPDRPEKPPKDATET